MNQEKQAFFRELIERRIPYVIGGYVAAVWLLVEIGDWVSERFSLSSDLSTYIFVGALALLPSVVLIAWGHAKPGKDHWNMAEKTFIPFNVLLAVLAVVQLAQPVTAVTQVLTVSDEVSGAPVRYEVAKEGYSQRIMTFFWDNDSGDASLDWMSYAGGWLLAEDLQRSPVIQVVTPYNPDVLDELRGKGFNSGQGEPLALDLKIAGDKSMDWLVRGAIDRRQNEWLLKADVYKVSSGERVKSIEVLDGDWISAMDRIADEVGEWVSKSLKSKQQLIPELTIAEHTSSSTEAIQSLIRGVNGINFENDYQVGIEALNQALMHDTGFATARVILMNIYRLNGDLNAASEQAREALKLDYKLYQETEFMVKAHLYSFSGDVDKVIKVLENWAKVYPQSTQALSTLSNNYQMAGQLENAAATVEQLLQLEPNHDRALNRLADIRMLQGRVDESLELRREFIRRNPANASGHVKYGQALMLNGQWSEARAAFEEAVIFDSDNMDAEILLVKIDAAEGRMQAALDALQALRDRSGTDQQHFDNLVQRETLLLYAGRIEDMLTTMDASEPYGRKILPPLAQLFMLDGKRAASLAMLGRVDEALAMTQQIRTALKPPYDDYADSLLLSVYEITDQHAAYSEVAERLMQSAQKFPIPTMEPFLLSAQARSLHWQGQSEQALEVYDRAITASRRSIIFLQTGEILVKHLVSKAEVLLDLQRYPETVELLREVERMDPLNGEARLMLMQALWHSGEWAEAQAQREHLQRQWAQADAEYAKHRAFLEFTQIMDAG